MIRDSAHEEFARWWEYLIAMIPSTSVDLQRSAAREHETKELKRTQAQLRQRLKSTDITHGAQRLNPLAIVQDVHPGPRTTLHEPQIWGDQDGLHFVSKRSLDGISASAHSPRAPLCFGETSGKEAQLQ